MPQLIVPIPGIKTILSDKSYCDPLEPRPIYLSYHPIIKMRVCPENP